MESPPQPGHTHSLVHPAVLVMGLQNILVVLNISKIRDIMWKSGWARDFVLQ